MKIFGKRTFAVLFSVITMVSAVTPAFAASKPIKTDEYYIVSAVDNNKCVDVNCGSTSDGANVQLWERNQSGAQTFRLRHYKSGYYAIQNVRSGKMLDVDGGRAADGTNVLQWSSHGGDNQRWKIIKAGNGYYYIKSKLGYYLDVNGASSSNGTNIQIWSKNKSSAQKFKFVPRVKYSYKTYRLKFNTIEGWRRAVRASQASAMGLGSGFIDSKGDYHVNNGIICGVKALSYKTITVRGQDGMNVGKITTKKIRLPNRIKYKIHKHTFRYNAVVTAQAWRNVVTCSCGYHDVFEWEIPWDLFDPSNWRQ